MQPEGNQRKTGLVLIQSMSRPKRYFLNKLPDYSGGDVSIPTDVLHERLSVMIQSILKNQGQGQRDCQEGMYVGVSGVAYAFYYISSLPAFADNKDEFLKHAYDYIELSLKYVRPIQSDRDLGNVVGLLLGNAGTYAVASLIFAAKGEKDRVDVMVQKYASASKACLHPRNADEMLVGRAGYLCGVQTLRKKLKMEILNQETVFSVCSAIVTSGREYSQRHRSPSPLMFAYYDTEYLGAAHGLSGILQVLLGFPEYLKSNPDVESDVKGSVDFMLGLQQTNGNFPCAMDEVPGYRSEQDELFHWCHGAPGVVYLMAKAYLYWQEPKYLESCIKCGDIVWAKGLLRKGPGICHGVAGNGYVFLLLYRLTQDKRHLHRALKFADFMYSEEFRKEARTPDCPYSLYEGTAGTVCYLADLFEPENAEFPFFNVF